MKVFGLCSHAQLEEKNVRRLIGTVKTVYTDIIRRVWNRKNWIVLSLGDGK